MVRETERRGKWTRLLWGTDSACKGSPTATRPCLLLHGDMGLVWTRTKFESTHDDHNSYWDSSQHPPPYWLARVAIAVNEIKVKPDNGHWGTLHCITKEHPGHYGPLRLVGRHSQAGCYDLGFQESPGEQSSALPSSLLGKQVKVLCFPDCHSG